MKRAFVVFAMAFIACSEGGPQQPPVTPVLAVTPAAKPTVCTLSGLTGKVTLTREGKLEPAKPGPLFEGDRIDTAADGHALLKAGGREVELLEDSSFTVGKSLAELSLSSGELFFEEADGGEFSTTGGAARAGAGSRVKLDARDGGTTFVVGSGTLEFVDVEGDGGVASVAAGQRFVVGKGVLSFEDAPADPPPNAKPTVKLTPRGTVMVKSKTGGNAKLPLAGKELDELGSVTVDKSSQLRAQLGGAVLQFEGSSKGTVEPTGGDPRLRATLAAGGMRIFLEQGESVLLDGKKPITLRAKLAMTALVTPTKNGPRVEILAGQGETSVPDQLPRNADAGEVVVLKGKGLDASRRGAPVLSLPAGRNSRVFWGRAGDVGLAFAPGDAVMEVATDAAFSNVLAMGSGGDSLVVPGPLKGALFWRRRGDSESSSGRFERDEFAGAVTAKSDTVAETGLKATVYFQSAVPTLTFTFPLKDGASAWRFRVYATGDLKTALVDRKVTENRTVVDSGSLKEGNYVWSAVPLDRSGQESNGGRMNKMEIVFDNSLTRLVLNSPRDGERATQATGVAPLGSKLFLNGKPVTLDSAGRFSVAVGTTPGLVFRLVAKEGGEAWWVRRR